MNDQRTTYTNDEADLEIRTDKNYGCFMHFHNMIEIVYYLDGTHYATINGKTRQMTADEISISNKLDIHKYNSPNQGRLILLQLPNSYLQSFYSLYPSDNCFHRFLAHKNANKQALAIMERLLTAEKDETLLKMGLVNELLFLLIKEYGVRSEIEREPMQEVLIYINENYREELSRDEIARKFGFNPAYFSTKFKKFMGLNFGDYVNMTRYNMVDMRLKNNTDGLKKTFVILDSGFQTTLNYYRFAKKMKILNETLNDNINQTISPQKDVVQLYT